jgi:hypothetical protein
MENSGGISMGSASTALDAAVKGYHNSVSLLTAIIGCCDWLSEKCLLLMANLLNFLIDWGLGLGKGT